MRSQIAICASPVRPDRPCACVAPARSKFVVAARPCPPLPVLRTLLRVETPEARSFYEIEGIRNNWAERELERQINSSLYERLALSRDKKGLLRLAIKGHEVQRPADVFKDPVVIEFLGLPESPKLVETDLEQALIDNLQTFLLELGRGFAFVARQERLTLDGDHFYIDRLG